MMTVVPVGGRGSIGQAGRAWKYFALSLIAGRASGSRPVSRRGSAALYQWRGYADGTRVVRPAQESAEPAESAARTLRRPGAMMATGAAGQLWTGRWCPVAARTAEPGKQIDVVSNQYDVAAGTWTRQRTAGGSR